MTDRTRAVEPWFLLTAHTLMVGDLGRNELAANAQGDCFAVRVGWAFNESAS